MWPRRWSPYEVARRYLTIMRIAKCMSDDLPLPNEKRIQQAVRNKKAHPADATPVEQYFLVYGYSVREYCPPRQ